MFLKWGIYSRVFIGYYIHNTRIHALVYLEYSWVLRVFKAFCAHSGLYCAVVAFLAVMLEKILTSQ